MKLEVLLKFRHRARALAVRLGFLETSEDIAQSAMCKLLDGTHNHSTIQQVVIDCIRDECGRSGSGKQFYTRAPKRRCREYDWVYDPTDQMNARIDCNTMWEGMDEKTRARLMSRILARRGNI